MMNLNVQMKEIKSTLDEQQAIRRASEVLSELFVFSVFGTIVVAQYYSTKWETEAREQEIEERDETLEFEIEQLRAELKYLSKMLRRQDEKIVQLEEERRRSGAAAAAASRRSTKRLWAMDIALQPKDEDEPNYLDETIDSIRITVGDWVGWLLEGFYSGNNSGGR